MSRCIVKPLTPDVEEIIRDALVRKITEEMDEALVMWLWYLSLLDHYGMDYEQKLLPEKASSCGHARYSFEKMGRVCFDCGTFMVDWGD